MSTITREQLIEDLKASTQNPSGMFEIGEETICALMSLLTSPPASVALPVQHWEELCRQNPDMSIGDAIIRAAWWNHCAAMLQGADNELQRKAAIHDALSAKYNVESLADFVDWQRNHIAELEAAPPAPVGHGEAEVMPDYPGYVMTQRECFEAGKKAGLAEAGNSPVIPDGWVACSKRMPEAGDDMIVFTDDIVMSGISYSKKKGFYIQALEYDDDEPVDNVTHWMPLPAAPQQEDL